MTNKEYVLTLAQMYASGSASIEIYSKAIINPSYTLSSKNKEFAHIPFYTVGHNASHTFYLGVDDNDKVYYRAYSYYEDQIEFYSDCKHKEDTCKCYAPENFIEYESDNIRLLEKDLQNDPIYMGHW